MDKVAVHVDHINMALDGIMGMFEWGRAEDQGLVSRDYCDIHGELSRLRDAVLKGIHPHAEASSRAYAIRDCTTEQLATAIAQAWKGTLDVSERRGVTRVANCLINTCSAGGGKFDRGNFVRLVEMEILK